MNVGIQETKNRTTNKNSRIMIAIVIVCFYILLMLFSALADYNNDWSPFYPVIQNGVLVDSLKNALIRTTFSVFSALIIFLAFFLGIKEIGDVFYRTNKKIIYWFIGVNSVFYLVITFTNIAITQFHNIYQDLDNIPSKIHVSLEWLNNYRGSVDFSFLGLMGLMVITHFVLILYLLKKVNRFNKKDIINAFGLWIFFSCGIYGITYTVLNNGWTTFLYLLLLVSMNDSFAYAFGKRFGKTKMVPNISPNKTWGGAIYGLITTLLIMLFVTVLYNIPIFIKNAAESQTTLDKVDPNNLIANIYYLTTYWQSQRFVWFWWFFVALMIFFLSIVSILGDLYFSYVKRQYQIKDYSTILKGHGGILDRFDSVCFVFIAFMIFRIFVS
ncbi:phosphatidate cytidylyltransferase [Mycoplasma bradburyae]|nr:phosphatidate cytidylyltransferase [Mycoplasma bradburyae]